MRKPRILVDGATYHVYFRTNRSEFTLTDIWVKEMFIGVVDRAKKKYGFILQSLCIMSNHVHMVIRPLDPESYGKWEKSRKDAEKKQETKLRKNKRQVVEKLSTSLVEETSEKVDEVEFKGSLSRIMQYILGVFAQNFNRKLEIQGHFWGDRFKSAILASLMRFLRAIDYIDQNPVVAKLALKPEEYEYGRLRLSFHGPPALIDPIEEPGQIVFWDKSKLVTGHKGTKQTEDSAAEKFLAIIPGVQFTIKQAN